MSCSYTEYNNRDDMSKTEYNNIENLCNTEYNNREDMSNSETEAMKKKETRKVKDIILWVLSILAVLILIGFGIVGLWSMYRVKKITGINY